MADLTKKSITKPPAILILADFSDGSWHALSFATKFLYTPKSPLFILQTFQNLSKGIINYVKNNCKNLIIVERNLSECMESP